MRRLPRRALALPLLLGALTGGAAPPAAAAPGRGVLPVAGASVVGAFDPPVVRWGAGHRGVDLAAAAGSTVVAPRDGVVTYAGILAGRGVLVLRHGATRSTFEPVTALVPAGAAVSRGQPIGRLDAGHACAAPACLHWGLKRGEDYLNPLALLLGEVRLLSAADAAAIATQARG
nr:M23 family metallopeptidase [Propionibacterium sp.]